jgi:hypothetical protein
MSRPLSAPTDWLHPSVLQLADKLLQEQLATTDPMCVLHALLAGNTVGADSPMAHPRLAAAAGLTPNPALAAQVAAAVQQVGAVTATPSTWSAADGAGVHAR